jgi:hypothetical protein
MVPPCVFRDVVLERDFLSRLLFLPFLEYFLDEVREQDPVMYPPFPAVVKR